MMKSYFLALFSDFFSSSMLPKGINSCFLVLVPKVAGTCSLSEFRPNSLINGVYKLISKVLSLQFRSVLPSIISETQ